MKDFLKDESGQSLVLIVLCMTVLTGFLGLAIDVGLLYRTKQNAQIAADAAAVAGTQNLLFGAMLQRREPQERPLQRRTGLQTASVASR
jgi:uncharacterized membrane protein